MAKLTDAEVLLVLAGSDHPWDEDKVPSQQATDEHPWDGTKYTEHPWDDLD